MFLEHCVPVKLTVECPHCTLRAIYLEYNEAYLKSRLESKGDLLSDQLIRLSEDVAALGVTKNCPFTSNVLWSILS